jgi:hypothetical protein
MRLAIRVPGVAQVVASLVPFGACSSGGEPGGGAGEGASAAGGEPAAETPDVAEETLRPGVTAGGDGAGSGEALPGDLPLAEDVPPPLPASCSEAAAAYSLEKAALDASLVPGADAVGAWRSHRARAT